MRGEKGFDSCHAAALQVAQLSHPGPGPPPGCPLLYSERKDKGGGRMARSTTIRNSWEPWMDGGEDGGVDVGEEVSSGNVGTTHLPSAKD